MIFVVYKAKDRWSQDSIQSFELEKDAIQWLQDKPRTGIIAVFKGERLSVKIGETKVVKKVVTSFEAQQQEEG